MMYASENWITRLMTVKAGGHLIGELLFRLHHFFTAEGVKNWIKYSLTRRFDSLSRLSVSVEEQGLSYIVTWLAKASNIVDQPLQSSVNDEKFETLFAWTGNVISCGRGVLGELVGKAATRLWFDGPGEKLMELSILFRLALKYYRKCKDHHNSFDDLQNLAATDFKDMANWAGILAPPLLEGKKLGVAYFALKRWEESIRCLTTNVSTDNFQTCIFWALHMGLLDVTVRR